MALNTAQSIVDFLKSRGLRPQTGEKFPFYETRGQLYGRLGLSANLGEFRGTAEQNTALLQNLQQAEKSTGISITSENLFNVAMVGMGGGTQAPTQLQPTPMEQPTAGQATTGTQPTPTQLSQPAPAQPPPPTAITQPQETLPMGDVSSLLPQVPETGDVTQQALEMVQGSATFPLTMEAQEAEKEAIRLGAQRQKESFIQQIASRGLFFSGAKTKGLQTVEADQLSQILGVDRKFALLIAQGLETATQTIVKEAQKGRTEAIDSLKALGYAINPLTGKVEPTLQAQQAQAQEQRLAAGQQEQVRQFEVTQERLRAQQEVDSAQTAFNQAVTIDQRRIAQSNLEIAQRKLALEEQKEQPITPTQIRSPQDLSPLAKAVYDKTIKLTDITPSQRANIAPELNAVGYTSVIKEEDQRALTFIKGQMETVMKKWTEVPNGCKGTIQGSQYNLPCLDNPSVAAFNTSVGFVSQQLATLVENGRLTDTDRAFYMGLMPNRSYQNPVSAKNASDEMQRLLKEKLNTDTKALEKDIINATQTDIDYLKSLGY